MPRLAQAPKRSGSRTIAGSHNPSPFKSPVKIPLNDDAQEKAQRSHGRRILYDAQINKLKAAATGTPVRKISGVALTDLEGDANVSPDSRTRTMRVKNSDRDMLFEDDVVVGGSAVTPMKRVPILANFEEWMKMATDNKINATNSWNFALIDYFHDMSLLKEGDGVNFQKASCTLDGCVKIYTSRVDSVATETGKLLSGLADSRDSKKREREGDEGDEDEDELDDDGNVRKKAKRKAQRSSEATLAPSFASLQLKKFELEFAVDPLFKKASADFDEGGAKGLLLNHLMIDSQGRIVFDSSDDFNEVTDTVPKSRRNREMREEGEEGEGGEAADVDMSDDHDMDETSDTVKPPWPEVKDEDVEIDMAALADKFLPNPGNPGNLGRLDELCVCPSLKTFELGDPSGSLDIPFLKAPEDWRQDQDKERTTAPDAVGNQSGMFVDEENAPGFDDEAGLGALDLGDHVDFGQGGEAWAREAALAPQVMRVFDAGLGIGDGVGADGEGNGVEMSENGDFGTPMAYVTMSQAQKAEKMHEDILGYFDQALSSSWTSAEHWRIRKIKESNKTAEPTRQRKEKQPFEIDFTSPLDAAVAEAIYMQASTNTAITLPKKDWKSKSRNLLPDDRHFHSKQLLGLFLKPKARPGRRRTHTKVNLRGGWTGDGQDEDELPAGEMDEAFWASQKAPLDHGVAGAGAGADAGDDKTRAQADYDADFFADDGLPFLTGGDDADELDDFADARDHFSPDALAGVEAGMADVGMTVMNPADLAFGTMLVTQSRRVRPEYVQYARVAKKVDVRRLKEEIWKGMGFDGLEKEPAVVSRADDEANNPTLKFTHLVNGLQRVYPKSVMEDISTSYCFICTLHLANEMGLVIEQSPDLSDLMIRKDWSAEIAEGGAE